MKKIIFMITLFVLVSITATAQTKKTIAVPVFEGGSVEDGEVLSDLVSTEFADKKLFEVVTRTSIETIMTENNFQRSGLTDTSIALGKILNTDYIAVGRIGVMGGVTIITIQIIDVKKGSVVTGESSSIKDFSVIITSIEIMVTKLIESILTLNIDEAIAIYVGKKDVSEIKSLLAQGINAKNNDGLTALMIASFNGHTEIVKALIAAGTSVTMSTQTRRKAADVNVKDNSGWTALIMASRNGHTEIVMALIVAGADVNAKNNDGRTALFYASGNGHTDTVKALIIAKADINAKTNDGKTALLYASQEGILK